MLGDKHKQNRVHFKRSWLWNTHSNDIDLLCICSTDPGQVFGTREWILLLKLACQISRQGCRVFPACLFSFQITWYEYSIFSRWHYNGIGFNRISCTLIWLVCILQHHLVSTGSNSVKSISNVRAFPHICLYIVLKKYIVSYSKMTRCV